MFISHVHQYVMTDYNKCDVKEKHFLLVCSFMKQSINSFIERKKLKKQ